MKKPKATEGQRLTLQWINAYLAKHGIPKHMIQEIQISMIYDAITQGHDMQYDRIYTGIALMLRKEFGFGVQRIMRGLHAFDEICGSVLADNPENEKDWTDIMQELKDETGIVIHTGDENRLIAEISRE